ncbi:hypothetical protein [Clostridium algidicarnis]|uniref:hypothetical protein n=1 Tax=Clostridium algidicarnis TaxID=37659 RepID=UPI003FD7C23C
MIKDYIFDVDKNELYNEETCSLSISDFIHPNFYDKFEFHDYHQKFTDEVVRLAVRSNDKFIGYCYFGIKDNECKAPYSAPFSLIHLKKSFKINDACLFINGIKNFAVKKGIKNIKFTLPPEIYGFELVSVLSATFFSEGFKVKSIELNNSFDLSNYEGIEMYLKESPHKVRKNYRKALKNELEFEQIEIYDFEKAYDVIKINREQMGYPLKISKKQMEDLVNINILGIRSFIVKKSEEPIAAALIFDVTEEVSQVVYWGDIIEYRNERPMDLLTTEIFNVYKKLGKKYLDIGPSSEDGTINGGLAEFKKSIGCNSNIKIVFEYEI